MHVRALTLDDIEAYTAHIVASHAESGVDGVPRSHVYCADEPIDVPAASTRERTRWTTPLSEPGWRRAWGVFDGEALVGHLYLAGGRIRSELHRANLGMGLLRTHFRRGGGRALMRAAVAWARAEARLDWLDLGVFTENEPAEALYRAEGFVERGRVPDRFRVDGVRIDNIAMALWVGEGASPGATRLRA